jgi:hypothetical protein
MIPFGEAHLIFALDYDETFTDEPILWEFFINKAKERGHSVTFVTSRGHHNSHDYNDDIFADAKRLGIEVVFCFGEQKISKFKADVWIDDCPLSIPSEEAIVEKAQFLEFKGVRAQRNRKPPKRKKG